MNLVIFLLNPAMISLAAVALSVVWMLRDEKDRTRPILVIALILNLVYGWVLRFTMGQENGLVPMKYDHVLFRLDDALGVSAPAIASQLQGWRRTMLSVVYQAMVPMMIVWFFVMRARLRHRSLVIAYVAEMLTGPLLYALVPGCGPAYAFGSQWLHPPAVEAGTIRLSGMPNAFPSLHMGTAAVFLLFAPSRRWRLIALAFFAGTGLATIATGEHYVIDLVAGLAFGCFAVNTGERRLKSAAAFLGVAAAWSLTVRFGFEFLLAHEWVLLGAVLVTVSLFVFEVARQWRAAGSFAAASGSTPAG